MKLHKQPTPEFSRPVEAGRIPATGSHEKIKADAKECEAVAKRLKVTAIHGLSVALHVKPWRGGGLKVTGTVTADLEQLSVISLENFRSTVSYPVERYFMPKVPPDASSEEDIDPIEGGLIDLGEIATEALALELDPYPRKPGEVFASGPDEEGTVVKGPFAGLEPTKSTDK